MSVRAPDKRPGTHRRSGRRRRVDAHEPPLFGFAPPPTPRDTGVGRHRPRRRRGAVRTVLVRLLWTLLLSGLLIGGAALYFQSQKRPVTRVPPKPPAGSPALLAWSVHGTGRSYMAVVGLPPGRPPVVVAVPGQTQVDLPSGGPKMIEQAGPTPGTVVAALQAAFDQPIGHYLVTEVGDFENLIDRLGGISVLLEEPITWEGQDFGPGDATLTGGAAALYLETAAPQDVTGRWEDVLTGVLGSVGGPNFAQLSLGTTDDPAMVSSLLVRARGAAVLELPTAPIEGSEGIQVDRRALNDMRLSRFPGIGGKLVRVIVLNGNGKPGIGDAISTLLAPAGYRVVASQNMSSFDTPVTQVIAATTDFLGQANKVHDLLGVGKVYVGPQPTGIADITIVVGKDYAEA
jgi:LytR cell envelope-related transcriptional attenuator/LytR_cpsA_psr family